MSGFFNLLGSRVNLDYYTETCVLSYVPFNLVQHLLFAYVLFLYILVPSHTHKLPHHNDLPCSPWYDPVHAHFGVIVISHWHLIGHGYPQRFLLHDLLFHHGSCTEHIRSLIRSNYINRHCAKKPVTTMLTYPWKCTVLHCNHLGNTWKPLVLMT